MLLRTRTLTRLATRTTTSTPPTTRPFTATTPSTMRVPYAPNTPQTPAAEPVYARISARRHPRPLIPLDLALLHNPAVADGWSSFLGAIRTQTSVPAGLRELAISRVAVLNQAGHEWDVHARLALGAGVSEAAMRTVFDLPCLGGEQAEAEGQRLEDLSEEQRAVLRYTDEMTRHIRVSEPAMAALKEVLGETQVVELTATVAAYNCVSRFLVALDVGECNEGGLKGVEELVEGKGH